MMTLSQHKRRLIKNIGYASKILMTEYAIERREWLAEKVRNGPDFDPFTDDPNCKSCRKKKK